MGILDKQVHPMVQMLFRNSDAVFQDDSLPIHSAISVQSWLQKHEDAFIISLASIIASRKCHQMCAVIFRY